MEARRAEITVVQARERKLELERAIFALILDFTANTGFEVKSIDVRWDRIDDEEWIIGAYVETRL